MKIAIVAQNHYLPENKNGINKINFHLVKGLQDLNKEIRFFSIEDDILKRPLKRRSKSSSLLQSTPFNIITDKDAKSVAKHLDEISKDFDIIHLSSINLLSVVKFLSSSSLKKVFFSAVDSLSLFYKRRSISEANLFLKLVYKLEATKASAYQNRWFPLCPLVHFVSSNDAKGVENSIVINNGVDLEAFRPTKVLREDFLLFTGNMNYGPNVDAALFLANEVMPKLGSKKLKIVGANPTDEVKALNKNPNIEVTGFVDDLNDYLNRCALYIAPISFGAGIKNKVLEAMSAGAVVVGSPVSFDSIPVRDGEHAFLVEGFDSNSWANKISKVLLSSRLENIAANTREMIEKDFSWESKVLEYVEAYKKLAKT